MAITTTAIQNRCLDLYHQTNTGRRTITRVMNEVKNKKKNYNG